MLRSILAVAAGYLSIAFLNGFTRVIISFYHREEILLSGVSALPSQMWVYLILVAGFLYGIFGGLITSTLAQKSTGLHILFLAAILILSGTASYVSLAESEPLWWLFGAPSLKIAGVAAGYQLKQAQDRSFTNASDTTPPSMND